MPTYDIFGCVEEIMPELHFEHALPVETRHAAPLHINNLRPIRTHIVSGPVSTRTSPMIRGI